MLIAVGCTFGVIINLRDSDRVPMGFSSKIWKGLCWTNAVLFGLGGIFNAFQAGQ